MGGLAKHSRPLTENPERPCLMGRTPIAIDKGLIVDTPLQSLNTVKLISQ